MFKRETIMKLLLFFRNFLIALTTIIGWTILMFVGFYLVEHIFSILTANLWYIVGGTTLFGIFILLGWAMADDMGWIKKKW